MEKRPRRGIQKIYTKEEWANYIEELWQYRVMSEKNPALTPKLGCFCVYTVTDLGNGSLLIQGAPKVTREGQHALHGCPFIVKYLFCLHDRH